MITTTDLKAMKMNSNSKGIPQTSELQKQSVSSTNPLWTSLSDHQQESVNGGWPKIKWPPGNGNGGAGGSNGGNSGSI